MNPSSQEASFLEQLRSEFDRDFVQPARAEAADLEEYLGFGAAEGKYAVPLREVSAVQEIRTVTRVPGGRAGFEGLVSVQDQLVAVFDLAILIAASGQPKSRRWLLVCQADRQVGFTVDSVDGYLQVPRAQIAEAHSDHRLDSIRRAIGEGRSTRLVVDFNALITTLRHDIEVGGQTLR